MILIHLDLEFLSVIVNAAMTDANPFKGFRFFRSSLRNQRPVAKTMENYINIVILSMQVGESTNPTAIYVTPLAFAAFSTSRVASFGFEISPGPALMFHVNFGYDRIAPHINKNPVRPENSFLNKSSLIVVVAGSSPICAIVIF
jgi:hypothetical protein